MIKIEIQLDDAGLLSRIRATGHSGAAAKGHDIVCASASVLLRTLARTLESGKGISLEGSAEESGEFFLDIRSFSDESACWIRGITSYSIIGLKDLETEYPDYCSVSINQR